jgi:hypothetical protein
MTEEEEWAELAKARLARPRARRTRSGSVASQVQTLWHDVAAARAAGKTWDEIAVDLAGQKSINANTVRIAFNRHGHKLVACAPAAKSRAKRPHVTVSQPKAPGDATVAAESPMFADMFAPLLDARDTKGRQTLPTSTEETSS